jgi:hypothetical protein
MPPKRDNTPKEQERRYAKEAHSATITTTLQEIQRSTAKLFV